MSAPQLVPHSRVISWLRTFSRTHRMMLSMGMPGMMIAGWYGLFYVPTMADIVAVKKDIQDLTAQYALFSQKVAQNSQIEAIHKKHRKVFEGKTLVGSKRMMAEHVFACSKATQVHCLQVKPGRQKQGKVYEKELFEIVVAGTYEHLLAFMAKLYEVSVATKVVSSEMQRVRGQSIQLRMVLDVVKKLHV